MEEEYAPAVVRRATKALCRSALAGLELENTT
jgi:hypothetical protein